jgi:endoglucanase
MSYRVVGNKLFQDLQEIQLIGTNVIGAELNDAVIGGLWSGLSVQQFVSQIKDMGFNSLRIPIGPKCLQNVAVNEGLTGASWNPANSSLKGKKSLEIMDAFVDEFEKQGLRYIFDHHYLEDGKIPDKWYSNLYSESQWLADLAKIASHFKGRAGFVGIDVKNEPANCSWGDGSVSNDWKLAAEKAYKAISDVNPDIIIIVEWLGPDAKNGLQQMVDKPLDIPLKRLGLSPHVYFADVWSNQSTHDVFAEGFKAPEFPNNMTAIYDRMFGKVAQKQLVIIGEYGGWYGKKLPQDKVAQDFFIDYCQRQNVVNTFQWGLGDNSGADCGSIYSDGGWKAINADKVANIMRLKTSFASYTTDKPVVQPEPEVQIPIVIPEPAPIPSTPSAEVPSMSIPDKIDLGLSDIPTQFKVDLGNPLTQEQTFNIPEKVTISMEGLQAASGGQGGNASVNVPELVKMALGLPEEAIQIDQSVAHSFGAIPQITLNLRTVPPTVVPEVTAGRKFAVGAKVFLALGTGINAIVIGYQGENTRCVYFNALSGEVSYLAVPETVLTAR